MRNAQLIPAKGEQGVVTFTLTVKVEGKNLTIPSHVQVYGLTVSKEVNRIPYAKVLIVDGDPAAQDFEVSNEKWFEPGNDIEISMGYLNGEARVFKGIVIKQQISVRRGSSFLEVECRDTAYRMTLRRQGRYFENLTDSELAQELLGAYEIKGEIADTRHRHADIVQHDCTDWDLLVSRMEMNGLLTIMDDGAVRIQAPDFGQKEPALWLHYGATVLEFDGGLELRDQFEEVAARAWNPAEQALVEIPASKPGIQQNGNLPGEKLAAANGKGPSLHRHGGNLPEGELQAWADARLMKDRLSRTSGRVQFQGYNEVKVGQIVGLQGFGKRFDGPVYVSAVHQEYLEAGWLTEIEFGLSPKWFAEMVRMEAPSAAAMLPAVSGLQIGVVTQIEEDPQGEHRVRVRLPILDPDAAGIWARVATLDAGQKRGTFFLPEVSDEVIVGFIQDDPRDAVLLGMLHSSKHAAPFAATADNLEKGYVSREGLRMVFHEKNGSITLETPKGNRLVISDKGKGLLLADQNGNQIQLDDKGITLKSAKDIKVEATGEYASKSAMTKLQASGVMEVKGSLVKIN